MNQKIEEQEAIMKEALDLITEMRNTEGFYNTIDPDYCKKKIKPMQEQYAFIMSRLAGKIIHDAGCDVTVVHSNVVQIAEEVLS